MKRLLVLLVAWSAALASANDGDVVTGVWLTEPGDGYIRVTRAGDRYEGVIAGAPEGTRMEAHALDVNNPDPALQGRELMHLVIMGDYEFDGRRWSGGWIYDPDSGKRYKSRLELRDPDTLEVRGYIGTPFLGQTQVWTRVDPAAVPMSAD